MTSNTPDVSERLAQTFATWQMYFLGHEIEVAMQHQQGKASREDMAASQKGTRLPHVILNNNITDLNISDWQPLEQFASEIGKRIVQYENFPYELFRWNRASRRVFHLPHSLEAMLAAAEFPDMDWQDVLWPFDSFIVTVEKPIVVRHPIGGIDQAFDTIMVTKTDTSKGFQVHLRWIHTPSTPGKKLGLNVSEINRFRSLLKKGRINDAAKLWDKRYKEIFRFCPFQIGSQNVVIDVVQDSDGGRGKITTEPHELYEKLGGMSDWRGQELGYDESSRSFFEGLSVTLRIVVGWMLYLESLTKDSAEWRPGAKSRTRLMVGGAPSIITEPDQICTIVGKGRIDPSEVTSELGQRCSKGFVRPHWRRAHYRRPAGSSHDAPKSQRIPPVLVRSDLVPLYGIIGGTSTVVISEK